MRSCILYAIKTGQQHKTKELLFYTVKEVTDLCAQHDFFKIWERWEYHANNLFISWYLITIEKQTDFRVTVCKEDPVLSLPYCIPFSPLFHKLLKFGTKWIVGR